MTITHLKKSPTNPTGGIRDSVDFGVGGGRVAVTTTMLVSVRGGDNFTGSMVLVTTRVVVSGLTLLPHSDDASLYHGTRIKKLSTRFHSIRSARFELSARAKFLRFPAAIQTGSSFVFNSEGTSR